jgi:hypothetical protein
VPTTRSRNCSPPPGAPRTGRPADVDGRNSTIDGLVEHLEAHLGDIVGVWDTDSECDDLPPFRTRNRHGADGHSPAVLLGTYAHLMPADHDRARSAVEAAFRLARHDRVTTASPVPEATL